MVGNRYETRKRKKMSRILNIAIGVVIVLILLVGGSIFLNGNSNETANESDDTTADNDSNQTGSGSAGIKDPASPDSNDDATSSDDDEDENQDSVADGRTEDDDDANAEDDTDTDDATEDEDREEDGQEDEEQDPLGTEQTGEFKPDFTQGSQNWNEMVAAVGSPQGLSSESEMTLWRLENGGSQTSAVGTFSDKNEQDSYSNPYRVRIEWQDGQGWQVVSTEQLSSNPYR
ncbi:YrrS family protein [Alkalihalobacillus sp. NPDC078783]